MFCLKSTLSRVGEELTRVKLENESLQNSWIEENHRWAGRVKALETELSAVTDKLLLTSSENVGKIYEIEGKIEELLSQTTNPEVAAMLKRVLSFVKAQ